MSGDYNLAKQGSAISLPPPQRCGMCRIELTTVSAHLNKDHCVRDLVQRVHFMREITAAQARQLNEIQHAIMATHRFAYAILAHFTTGLTAKLRKKVVRVVIERAEFERLPDGVAVTMTETENGSFEVVGVVPEKKAEAKPS